MTYVIGINGGPRKNKNSALLVEEALKGAASAGAETEMIHLGDLNFSGCRSCYACKLLNGKSFGRCIINDDLKPVLEKILNADAVIISSPIYYGDVTGMVRNLFERLWFPGLTYWKDPERANAYTHRVKAGLIYTMGMPDLSQPGVKEMIASHKATFERFLGETSVVTSHDGMQFSNYALYSGEHKLERKMKYREEQWPKDLENAYEMGRKLAE